MNNDFLKLQEIKKQLCKAKTVLKIFGALNILILNYDLKWMVKHLSIGEAVKLSDQILIKHCFT